MNPSVNQEIPASVKPTEQQSKHTSAKMIFVLLGTLLFGIMAGSGIGYTLGNVRRTVTPPTNEITPTPTAEPLVTPSQAATLTIPVSPTVIKKQTGMIEGSMSYPSEGIPEEIIVCAENKTKPEVICTNQRISDKKYQYGTGYKLEVPAGETYYVYEKAPGAEQQAYYSKFIVCGLTAECKDHTPVEVSVAPNATVSKVDPGDWYTR